MTIYYHKFVSTTMEDSPACACPVCSRNFVQEKNKLKGSQVFMFYGSLHLHKKPYIKTHFPPPPQPLALMAKAMHSSS